MACADKPINQLINAEGLESVYWLVWVACADKPINRQIGTGLRRLTDKPADRRGGSGDGSIGFIGLSVGLHGWPAPINVQDRG